MYFLFKTGFIGFFSLRASKLHNTVNHDRILKHIFFYHKIVYNVLPVFRYMIQFLIEQLKTTRMNKLANLPTSKNSTTRGMISRNITVIERSN